MPGMGYPFGIVMALSIRKFILRTSRTAASFMNMEAVEAAALSFQFRGDSIDLTHKNRPSVYFIQIDISLDGFICLAAFDGCMSRWYFLNHLKHFITLLATSYASAQEMFLNDAYR